MIAEANSAQVHELGQMWDALGSEIIEFGASLQRTAISSESIWTGQAATAARTRLSELVTWCQGTGEGMQYMGGTVMRTQAEAAEVAQRSMPAVVPYNPAEYQNRINSRNNPVEWVRIQGDAYEQAARHNAAHNEAIRVIETYSASLLSTNGRMPAFTPPPEFGNRDTRPGLGVPTPGGRVGGAHRGGGAGGSHGSGGGLRIAPGSTRSGPGGGSPVPHGRGPVLDGVNPSGGGHPLDNSPPVATPGQVASHVPGIPGASFTAGDEGAGVLGVLPTTAGISEVDAGRRGSSVGGGRGGGFGPRGSGALNALGQRGEFGVTGEADNVTGAERSGAGMASRALQSGPAAGGAFPPMVGGGPGRGKDTEHRRPSYLIETEDIWGDGRRVAPPVIGEDPPEYHY